MSEPIDQVELREIRLSIPADVRFLRVARLTAAGLAGDLGFGLQAIEDLRVAIDEMCALLIEGAPDTSELDLVYRFGPSQLTMEGHCQGSGGEPSIHPVAAELLRMTADEFEVSGDGVGRSFRLVKRLHDLPV